MATATKSAPLSLRITRREKSQLKSMAKLSGSNPGALAATFIREGVRRANFPAIDFRDGQPGRVAYLAGSRWPVWMIVQLAQECGGDIAKAASHMRKPPALVEMALAYANTYRDEIEACLQLHAQTTSETAKDRLPGVEVL
jgi:hypothetical protein